MHLTELGWDDDWAAALAAANSDHEDWIPARVACEERERYVLYTEHGELTGQVTGAFMNHWALPAHFPKIGDWVAVAARPAEGTATIHRVLPRRAALARKEAWQQTHEQILASNVDVVILVNGLDGELNLRRLERYLAMASACGIAPVIALNKADVCADPEGQLAAVHAVAGEVPIHTVSARDGRGMDDLAARVGAGTTVCFLGSSGVGKSSLVNRLLGVHRQATSAVSDFGAKGRHTTTRRELLLIPGGGLVIDTPGVREMQVWADESDVGASFSDITALAGACRFRDCRHVAEPGCAIRGAIEAGALDPSRYANYLKMMREAKRLGALQKVKAKRLSKAATRKWRKGKEATRVDRRRIDALLQD